jgi:uncharacterized protein YceH (UPF0502 family)
MESDAVELRVLGCLLEKQRTTPDAYPLSLNSLRLACNQATNRDPVVDYDEATIREALARLARKRWTRLASGARAAKYRHLLDEALGLADDELALLGVLLLRGPQTAGELNQRAARLHPFAGLEAVEATLERLIERELAARLPRRPGQKEERYVQRLGSGAEEATVAPVADVGAARAVAPDAAPDAAHRPAAPHQGPPARPTVPAVDPGRVAVLEAEVAALRADLAALRDEVSGLREALGG